MTHTPRIIVPSLSGGFPHEVMLDIRTGTELWRCDCLAFAGNKGVPKSCRHTRIAHAVQAALDKCVAAVHLPMCNPSLHPADPWALCSDCLIALVAGMTAAVKERYVEKPKCVQCSRRSFRTCTRCKQHVCQRCAGKHESNGQPCVRPPKPQSAQAARFTERVAWLLSHRDFPWEVWARLVTDPFDIPEDMFRPMLAAMVADGLLSEKTYWKDARKWVLTAAREALRIQEEAKNA